MPCLREFPVLEKVEKKFAERHVAVLTINTDRSERAMNKVLKEAKTSLTVLRDKESEVLEAYSAYAIPTVYLIDQQGKIYRVWTGSIGDLESQLNENIEFVLETRSAPQLAEAAQPTLPESM